MSVLSAYLTKMGPQKGSKVDLRFCVLFNCLSLFCLLMLTVSVTDAASAKKKQLIKTKERERGAGAEGESKVTQKGFGGGHL